MKKESEEAYIRKRKRKAFAVNMFYKILRVFPIKNNKIVFSTFEGDGGFCCNPRYIAEELLRRDNAYELVWLTNNMSRTFPKGIRKVENTFFNRAYHLATAKVWVDNARKEYGIAKRKNQIYIQTWHAALEFKPVGGFRGKLLPKMAYLISRYDSRLVDYLLSNSEWCTKRYPRMLFYDGRIIRTGSPRCDLLITKRDELYHKIRQQYHIPDDAKIVLFAPTFRGGGQKGQRQVFAKTTTLDFQRLIDALEQKFGGKWHVFLRLHPQLSAQLEEMPIERKQGQLTDVSQADDMNEVMAAADVFITDYSSSAFDAINIHMPVFLYADDLEEYTGDRGKLMWNMDKLPFTVAKTNEELAENIKNFDLGQYRNRIDAFLKKNGVLEDGKASSKVADLIEKKLAWKEQRQ